MLVESKEQKPKEMFQRLMAVAEILIQSKLDEDTEK